jgi:hypothetical protein
MLKVKQINSVLYDRIVTENKNYHHYSTKYNISKGEFTLYLSSVVKCQEHFPNELIVKAYKLFKSKVQYDEDIFSWNKKNCGRKKLKQFTFTNYSKLNESGRSIKCEEQFDSFFQFIQIIYSLQTKMKLQSVLPWVKSCELILEDDHICYYCGISENILSQLYNDQTYTCKTKRNRGFWFELDRKDASIVNNLYTKDNMVFCCYFCNNHKSDVISAANMRQFFGNSMFDFLIYNFKQLNK